MRKLNRSEEMIRPIEILTSFQVEAPGSIIYKMGNTVVNVSVMLEEKVPPFLNPEIDGWLTAEYSMLPASGASRITRDSSKGKPNGRSVEIQRLIGRSLRAAVDLKKIPGLSLWIDCDVLSADGGTRTTSINGAMVALNLAVHNFLKSGKITENPIVSDIAAISLGIVNGKCLLDLDYSEDSKADVDMNLVMNSRGEYVEVQSSAEGKTFSPEQFNSLLTLGRKGIHQVMEFNRTYLSNHDCPKS